MLLFWLLTGALGVQRVCISGGAGTTGGQLSTTECYDSSTRLWQATPSLSMGKINSQIAPINLGGVSCLVSGYECVDCTRSIVICTNGSAWINYSSIPTGRFAASAIYGNNWVGVTSGSSASFLKAAIPLGWIAAPTALTWASSPMATIVAGIVVNLNGTSCVSGGGNGIIFSTSLCLNQGTTWVPGPNLRVARQYSTSLLLPGQWCIAGGLNTTAYYYTTALNSVECISTIADFRVTNYTLANFKLPVPVAHQTNVTINGLSCLTGGSVDGAAALPNVWCANFSAGTVQWLSMSNMTTGRFYHSSWTLDDVPPTFSPTSSPTFPPTTFSPTSSPTFSPTSSPTTTSSTFSPTSPTTSSPTTGTSGLQRICVTGGVNSSAKALSTTECYDSSTGLWQIIPSLSMPAANFAMTPLNLGGISCLVAGYECTTCPRTSMICTNGSAWVTLPPLPSGRFSASAIYGNNWVGVTSGTSFDLAHPSFLQTAIPLGWILDPTALALSWSNSSMALIDAGTVVNLNGTSCVSGGHYNFVLSTSLCLDQRTTWITGPNLTVRRYYSTSLLLPGQSCVTGGLNNTGSVTYSLSVLNSVECISTIADFRVTNYALANFTLPVPIAQQTNVTINGLSCLTGGSVDGATSSPNVWCANFSAGTVQWLSMSNLTTGRNSHASWTLDDVPPTFSPTSSPTFAPTTFSPTSSPTTFTPTSSPTTISLTFSPTTVAPTSSPTTTSLITVAPRSSPTTSTPSLAPTTSPTRTLSIALGKESALTSGKTAGIVIPSSLILLLGAIFFLWFCWIRKRNPKKMKNLASKINEESKDLPKDSREVALDETIRLYEEAMKSPKMSGQNNLFLQSIHFGAKEEKTRLSQVSIHPGLQMTHLMITETQRPDIKVFNIENFKRVKFLSQGEGGSAELYKEKETSNEVVIKVPHHIEDLEAEAKVWSSIGLHPNVARMIGIVNLDDNPHGIVMEYYPGGSLDTTAYEFSSHELHRIAINLARGLQHLHQHKVIHRDLAARNILMTRDRRVAITDFGMSRQLGGKDAYRMMTDAKLPWRTLAPELLLMEDGARIFNEKTDIWALGVTLWELATKQSAYAGAQEEFKALQQKIGNGSVKLDMTPIIMTHPDLAAALVGCFNRDPTLRPTAEQLRWLLKDDDTAEAADRANYIAIVDGGEYQNISTQ